MTTELTLEQFIQLNDAVDHISTKYGSNEVVRFLEYIHTLIITETNMRFNDLLVNARVLADIEK